MVDLGREVEAMGLMAQQLLALDDGSRTRVLTWLEQAVSPRSQLLHTAELAAMLAKVVQAVEGHEQAVESPSVTDKALWLAVAEAVR